MITEEFPLPKGGSIIDPVTGYSINIPVIYQGWPFWWEDLPEVYQRIKTLREEAGIEVEDFPGGRPVRPSKVEVVNFADADFSAMPDGDKVDDDYRAPSATRKVRKR